MPATSLKVTFVSSVASNRLALLFPTPNGPPPAAQILG